MKILHVITEVETGGALSLIKKITNGNKNNNIKHIIVSLKKHEVEIQIPNIQKIYSLDIRLKIQFFIKLFYLIKIIRLERPDIVQTWMYHSDLIGGIAAKLAGIKNIYWSVLSYSTNSNYVKLSTKIVIYINALLSYIIPSKIIFCAFSSQEVHKKIGYCNKKFKFIPIGFDAKINYKIKENNQEKKKNFTLGCIARWDPDKDHNNLFEALKILDRNNVNYICELVGPMMTYDNQDLKKLINISKIDKSKLKLKGFVKDLNKAYENLDVCVLASRTEAFPIVIGEAMIAGTPVIATDTGDVRKIVNHFGWVVSPHNPKQLSESILDAISKSLDNKVWYKLRLDARNHIINNYSINDMVNSYNRLWNLKS